MISLCLIYCQEDEPYLSDCLSSLFYIDEFCLVKTIPGSKEEFILQGNKFLGGKIIQHAEYHYIGEFNFSKARNLCKTLATKKWLIQVDADECVLMTLSDFENLKSIPEDVGALNCIVMSLKEAGDETQITIEAQPRIVRNLPDIIWEYRIHENCNRALIKLGLKTQKSQIVFRHDGYNRDMKAKLERNLRALLLNVLEEPDNKHLLYKLKQTIETKL